MWRWVGHSARTSTKEKPRFSTWSLSPLRMAFWARARFLASNSATRSTYTGPSSWAMSSAMRSGSPIKRLRPKGLVAVFCPMRDVGAICPPVIP